MYREIATGQSWAQATQSPFEVTTSDGVQIRGVRLCSWHARLLIYCHGFMSARNYPGIPRFLERLARDLDVIAFDLRGHGESEGACTLGECEPRDLAAVANYAWELGYRRIVVMGSSMGGAVAIRYAAESERVAGVVTMGAFAHGELSAIGRLGLACLNLPGAMELVRVARRTRVAARALAVAPREWIRRLAPRPVLILHGQYDGLVPVTHAHELYARAREPKELHIIPWGSHDIENLNERTAAHVLGWMERHGL